MEKCTYWYCGTREKGGVRGSIEGGMGYWMYHIEKPMVSWLIPGTTSANYEVFGGTFLADRAQPCVNMGGAVRISNRLLVPNDALTFEEPDTLFGRDGMLGYMLQRTPLGKRSPTDRANYWTIIVDAGNFAGPVMMISSWFWDMRTNWHPKSKSWSDPSVRIGLIQEGFEGSLGAHYVKSNGDVFYKSTKWHYPLDNTSTAEKKTSTLFTAHKGYESDWADILEGILDGTSQSTHQDVLKASRRAGVTPQCNVPTPAEANEMHFTDDEDNRIDGFGISADTDATDKMSAGCPYRLKIDASDPSVECNGGWCEGSPYVKNGKSVPASAIPNDVKAQLDAEAFPDVRVDSRAHYSPADPEKPCFDYPGPADSTLYCIRTNAKAWIGFRWYKFVDQPELNQVFAALPDDERAAAKDYMQNRITNFHKMGRGSWFDEGDVKLPAGKANFDSNLLLTPPSGLEFGYVPVPVYQALRVPPLGCIKVGVDKSEPEPLPPDYYDGSTVRTFSNGREQLICQPREGESTGFSYPGTIFPYSPNPTQENRPHYEVPNLNELEAVLKQKLGDGLSGTTKKPTLRPSANKATKEPTPPPSSSVPTRAPTSRPTSAGDDDESTASPTVPLTRKPTLRPSVSAAASSFQFGDVTISFCISFAAFSYFSWRL